MILAIVQKFKSLSYSAFCKWRNIEKQQNEHFRAKMKPQHLQNFKLQFAYFLLNIKIFLSNISICNNVAHNWFLNGFRFYMFHAVIYFQISIVLRRTCVYIYVFFVLMWRVIALYANIQIGAGITKRCRT